MRRGMSMRVRLTMVVVLVFGFAVASLAFVLVDRVERALVEDARRFAIRELTSELTGVAAASGGEADLLQYFDENGHPLGPAEVDELFRETLGGSGTETTIVIGGGVAAAEEGFSFDVVPGSDALVVTPGVGAGPIDASNLPPVEEIEGDPGRITLGVPVEVGGRTVTFAISRSLHPVAVNLETMRRVLWWAIPLLMLLVGAVTWVVVGRTLRPVQQMATDVDRISSRDLSSRVSVPGGADEIAHMARTVNGMLDRIEESDARRRRFVSDASHELRSPIATIGAEMEVARAHPGTTDWERVGEVVLSEQQRLGSLVEDLLLLSRFDEGAARDVEDVDLDDVVLAEIERSHPIRIDRGGVEPVRVEGDPRLLMRLVGNLLSNAQRHADSEIRVTVRRAAGDAVLVVEDDGSGIPLEERERIFERFARAEEGRSRDSGGTGLGLSIVKAVTDAHGGRVKVDEGALGGARFTVTLPAARI